MKTNDKFYETDFDTYARNLIKSWKDYLDKETDYIIQNSGLESVVLEVGSGSGRVLEAVSPHVKKVIGIDNQIAQVESSKKRTVGYENIEVFLQDGRDIEFSDETFDLAYMTFSKLGSFEEDKEKVLREMKRVVKTEGAIIFGVYAENASSFQLEQYGHWGFNLVEITDDYTHTQNKESIELKSEKFSKEKLTNLLTNVGLEFEIKRLNDFTYICHAIKK